VEVLLDYRPALRARTGVGEYVHELAHALLITAAPGERLHLFTSSWKDRPDPSLTGLLPGVRIHDLRVPVGVLNWCWHRAGWPTVERLTRQHYDVVHAAHPLLIPSARAARVVTIHDLYFLDRPEHTRREIQRDYPALAAGHARRADGILTSSQHTAGQLVQRLGAPAERIGVARPGPPRWTSGGRTRPRDPRGYLLFLGTLEPRKNLGALLDAYELLLKDGGELPPLRVAGAETDAARDWLARMRSGRLAGHVTYAGYVPDAGRRDLFEGASMLILPSWHEGFGLPALEAMALGVPVVASTAGALPEVVGEAGLLAPPDDPAALARAIRRVLREPGLADLCVHLGLARVAEWSWERAADAVRRLYLAALHRRTETHARRD
jgi:glycosyltransferase involved in cell wall biosynthesis